MITFSFGKSLFEHPPGFIVAHGRSTARDWAADVVPYQLYIAFPLGAFLLDDFLQLSVDLFCSEAVVAHRAAQYAQRQGSQLHSSHTAAEICSVFAQIFFNPA